MKVTKHRPVASPALAKARGELGELQTAFEAAEAALRPHREELAELSAQRSGLRAAIEPKEVAIATLDDAREVEELKMQLKVVERLLSAKDQTLQPGGTLYHLVQARDGARLQLTGKQGDTSRQEKRVAELTDALATALANLYLATGDPSLLTFTLEVSV